MPGSLASIPSANAGKASVSRFSQSNWIGFSGTGKPASIATNMICISAILQDKRKNINLRIFAYIVLPYSTAATILAKLSSVKIISAASLATSVPVMPIAIPISALLSAGASLTPSPVIATI